MYMHTPKKIYIEVRSSIISWLVIHVQIITNNLKIYNRANTTSFWSPWLKYWTSLLATDSEIPPTSYEEGEIKLYGPCLRRVGLNTIWCCPTECQWSHRRDKVAWYYSYLCAVIKWKIKRTNLRSCIEMRLASSAQVSVQALVAQ